MGTINLRIVGAGWVDCDLCLGERYFTLTSISDTTDALGDLLRFALQIATGAYQATVSFDREPTEWRLVAVSLLDDDSGKGPVSISVFEFPDIYANAPLSSGYQVFVGDCGALEFASDVLTEVKRILPEFGRGFYPDPAAALRALECALDRP